MPVRTRKVGATFRAKHPAWRQSERGRASADLLRLSLVGTVIAVAVFVAVVVPWADLPVRAPSPSTSPGPFGPALALSSTRADRPSSSQIAIHGDVRNICTAPLRRTLVIVTWRDGSGQFITSDDALVDHDPVLAGQASPFRVVSTWTPDMASYVVSFTTLRGERLSSRDDRERRD